MAVLKLIKPEKKNENNVKSLQGNSKISSKTCQMTNGLIKGTGQPSPSERKEYSCAENRKQAQHE